MPRYMGCVGHRHVPWIPGRGVSPIGYLGLGEGLRGGEGALRKAISIGGCAGLTRVSHVEVV